MNTQLEYPNPYKKSGKIFSIPPYRHLGVGPCNMSANVANAMLWQPVTPVNKYLFKLMDDIQEMLKYVYQTKNYFTLAIQSSGNGGNEAMVTNLADPGDTIIVAIAGIWGSKVADMGRRYDLNVIALEKDPKEVYTFEQLEAEIIKHKPVALFVTHGESSTGTLQPLDGLGEICHKYDCLLAVDAVVSIAVAPLFVDRWKIDAVTGGTQKGLGAPAGMCLMSFSTLAHQRILKKKHPPPYIFDMLTLGDVWNCFGNKRTYHYTYGSPLLAAVRQALIEICEEGLEKVWERHQKVSDLFVSKLESLGMKHTIEKLEHRFCGTNIVVLPKRVRWPSLLEYIREKHEIECSFGIGPYANEDMNILRVGFLATSGQPEVVDYFVKTLEEGIKHCLENNQLPARQQQYNMQLK